MQSIDADSKPNSDVEEYEYILIPLEFEPITRGFEITKQVAIDTETLGLAAWLGDKPFAVSMANEVCETWYCEWVVDPMTRDVTPHPLELAFVKWVMENPEIEKVFHNGKFDIRMLEVAYSIRFRGRLHETLFAARACNSLEDAYSLKFLATKYCAIGRTDADLLQEEASRLRRQYKGIYKLHKDVYADYWLPKFVNPQSTLCEQYAVLDALRTMLLWKMYDYALDQEGTRILYDMEMSLWQCTYDMESRGVRINYELCQSEYARNKGVHTDALNQMRKLANDTNLNPNSHAQLRKFCETHNLVPLEITASGHKSMSFNSIRTIADHPFIHQLQRYRAAFKVNNTFISKYLLFGIPDHITKGGTCLHPLFNQAAAQTGRYGCSQPNLQQVVNANGARNAIETMSARMAFGPRERYTWYHFDYSQLELYLFAGLAEEHFMLQHMMEGHDLHAECANRAWGGKGNPNALIKGMVALECEAERPSTEDVERIWKEYGWEPKWALDRHAKEEFTAWWLARYGGDDWNIVKAEKALGKKVARTRAKFVMYAKIYGGGWRAINNFLYCGEAEARAFQFEYDAAFPRIKQFLRIKSREAERNGYVTNAYGRKVKIPMGYSYKSVNFLVQSSAADLLKSSMIKCYDYVHKCHIDWHLLLTIHDELVFEVPTDDLDGMELHEDILTDGTVKREYVEVYPSETLTGLRRIQALMEDHEGRFPVPIPVECARCDERWDRKIEVAL